MKEKGITIEDLAVMVQKGFENTATKDDIRRLEKGQAALERSVVSLEKRQTAVEQRLTHVEIRLGGVENEMKGYVPYREFEDLMARVKYLETHLKIESGK